MCRNKCSRVGLLTLLIILCAAILFTTQASAKTKCQLTPQGNLCISEVDFSRFAQRSFQAQEESQWCWVAAVSILFSYHKHPASQQRIVTSLYGTTVDLPSGPGWNIAARLNRD